MAISRISLVRSLESAVSISLDIAQSLFSVSVMAYIVYQRSNVAFGVVLDGLLPDRNTTVMFSLRAGGG